MFLHVWRKVLTGTAVVRSSVGHSVRVRPIIPAVDPARSFTDAAQDTEQPPPFDASLLELLVCPLSKKRLRYDSESNELINDELGIAYPIINSIPNMIPQDARLIKKDSDIPAQE